jgi:hypothetical protein
VRLKYQQQDSLQTLNEGLEEYYAANAGIVIRPRNLPPESYALFHRHDICHVIFGLSTTAEDEVMADTRTLLSCDVGMKRYAAYLTQDRQAQALFKEFGYLRSIWMTVICTPRICRAVREAWRMKKRWPWTPPDGYGSRQIADLRGEYGIRVI